MHAAKPAHPTVSLSRNSDTVVVPPILEVPCFWKARGVGWEFLDMVGADVSRQKSASCRSNFKTFSVILAWIPAHARRARRRRRTWWCTTKRTTPGIRGFTVFAWTFWRQWRDRWASRIGWNWCRIRSMARGTRRPASGTASCESSCDMYDSVCSFHFLLLSPLVPPSLFLSLSLSDSSVLIHLSVASSLAPLCALLISPLTYLARGSLVPSCIFVFFKLSATHASTADDPKGRAQGLWITCTTNVSRCICLSDNIPQAFDNLLSAFVSQCVIRRHV